MLFDRGDQLIGPLARGRDGADDRRLPRDAGRAERQHLREVTRGLVRAGTVGLVHHEHVGDLEHAGLDGLDVVTEPGNGDEAHGVGDAHDLDLLLPHSDGLDQNDAVPERVEDVDDARGGARETAGVTAARHAADEEALVEETLAHPNAVAEDRAAAEGRRRVHRDDPDTVGRRPVRAGEPVDERALATARWTGDTDDLRVTGERIQRAQRVRSAGLVVLDDGQKPRGRSFVAGPSAPQQIGRGDGHEADRARSLAITMRCTSLVPSPISMRRASRTMRSTG